MNEVAGGFAAAGLIDFGDLVHSITVAELSVAAAYALLDQPDPVDAVRLVALSFHDEFPLTEPERSVLFSLILARLGISVASLSRRFDLQR